MPVAGAYIGSLPVVLEFDTGDSGTLYLRAETRARLAAERQGKSPAAVDTAGL
jgi:hypothetical protein